MLQTAHKTKESPFSDVRSMTNSHDQAMMLERHFINFFQGKSILKLQHTLVMLAMKFKDARRSMVFQYGACTVGIPKETA